MEEAEVVSDMVIIINKGRIIATGQPHEIRSMIREKFKVIVYGNKLQLPEQKHAKLANKTIVYFRDENEATAFLTEVIGAGLKAEILPVSLEDAFIEILRENA
jgi:ABC-type multidrug transport system ATPase subunit